LATGTLAAGAIGDSESISHWSPRRLIEKFTSPGWWTSQGNKQDCVGFLDPYHVVLGGIYGKIFKAMGYTSPQKAIIYTTLHGFALFEGGVESWVPWEYGDLFSDLYGVMSIYP